MNYVNEFDPFAAAWLRSLIGAGHLPPAVVDERSILEVKADEVRGYQQCHWFGGIGGWPLALELAGWDSARPVWTGSCPCQPYSSAGKGEGDKDPRNLWPEFFRLIRECRPAVVFGEQVASADVLGNGDETAFVAAVHAGQFDRADRLAERITDGLSDDEVESLAARWLDRVSADLEGEGYTVGSAVLGAHSVGSPHIRQRLFWVAESQRDGVRGGGHGADGGAAEVVPGEVRQQRVRADPGPGGGLLAGGLADLPGEGRGRTRRPGGPGERAEDESRRLRGARGVGDADGERLPQREERDGDAAGGLGAPLGADVVRPGVRPVGVDDPFGLGPAGRTSDEGGGTQQGVAPAGAGEGRGFWDAFDLVACRDGKARRIEPGSFPLAHGVPARVGRLRGYGNAIVPQVAALFIRAYMEARGIA